MAPQRMHYRYPLILLLVTVVWGMTFPVLKVATGVLSGVEITTLRFCIAALCMLPFVRGISLAVWRDGFWLGALALFSMAAQAYGLQFIASNRSAFLTSLNVLMVPLLGLLLGGRPGWRFALPRAPSRLAQTRLAPLQKSYPPSRGTNP